MQRCPRKTIEVLGLPISSIENNVPNPNKKKKKQQNPRKKYKSHQCFLYPRNSSALDLPHGEAGLGTEGRGEEGSVEGTSG